MVAPLFDTFYVYNCEKLIRSELTHRESLAQSNRTKICCSKSTRRKARSKLDQTFFKGTSVDTYQCNLHYILALM